ncbi:MAG: DGQHR domain-containing protein [Defluviitaleaceae bacterium]|nr:DGQHR domain-containing protein [Defluviitaleaceae bacterium]
MKKGQKQTPDQLLRRKQTAFRRKIRNIFTGAGFEHIPTLGKEFKVGFRKIEIDALFAYENIIIVSEETCRANKDRDHIRTKNEAFHEINSNLRCFFEFVKHICPEKADIFTRYTVERYQVFYFYISDSEIVISDDERSLYSNLLFINPRILNYFQWMVQCIRKSAKYEIFRFLSLNSDLIGRVKSDSERTTIKAPIIYPEDITGLRNEVRVISFMMSAEKLLETCYVLRKDNWADSLYLYQRLIDKAKIRSIRNYLAKNGEAFYNNIIVALPDNLNFIDVSGKAKTISEIGNFEPGCKLEIPNEMNSICVIDGQHRIFAHFEGLANDRHEKKISELRKQLHLLVTGLLFPPGMPENERVKIQSEIFLDINSNAKPVPPDVLLQIETLKDPLSDIALARRVIEKLDKQQIFHNMFEFSLLEGSKIKIASIIKFALRYLVTTKPSENNLSLYNFWTGDKESLLSENMHAYESYIDFCVTNICIYFSAIKKNLRHTWENTDSKLLSVISINGFIIALNRQLKFNGIKDFAFYDEKFKNWRFDFSKENFPYTSSQYRRFSTIILKDVFSISETDAISDKT